MDGVGVRRGARGHRDREMGGRVGSREVGGWLGGCRVILISLIELHKKTKLSYHDFIKDIEFYIRLASSFSGTRHLQQMMFGNLMLPKIIVLKMIWDVVLHYFEILQVHNQNYLDRDV